MENINIVFMNMEYGIHEQVVLNHDGSYTIFLNSRDSHHMNKYGYYHAISHIMNNDFDKYDVQQIEYEAHRREHMQEIKSEKVRYT